MEKSKGLGDTIEKVTKATGIKKVVNVVSKIINVPCNCGNRKDGWNLEYPYKQ